MASGWSYKTWPAVGNIIHGQRLVNQLQVFNMLNHLRIDYQRSGISRYEDVKCRSSLRPPNVRSTPGCPDA